MIRRWLMVVLCCSSIDAFAEAGWLASQGKIPEAIHVQAFGGTDSFGIGALLPDEPGTRSTSWTGEVLWQWKSRVGEARLSRLVAVRQNRFASVSAFFGLAALLVPEGKTDLGLGPNGGLTLTLGGNRFWVDLGVQTGFEVFVRSGGPRFTERAVVAANLRLGSFTLSVMARIGADLEAQQAFVGRGEVIFAVGWLGS